VDANIGKWAFLPVTIHLFIPTIHLSLCASGGFRADTGCFLPPLLWRKQRYKSIMKTIKITILTWLSALAGVTAQDLSAAHQGLPLTISLFIESISLPTFRNIQRGGLGLKIGTEFYYRNSPGSQVIQTLTVGYYHHPRVQSGLFVNTTIGYRKYIGGFFTDVFIGGGALLLRPVAHSYVRDESTGNYRKAPATQCNFMPVVKTGVGYRFPNRTLVFARYELFGEMPFRSLILPHQSISIGTQLALPN
jgi:hypothetical protein